MGGCKVKFPAKAYPSQVAMMSKIITSLQRSQNALLESPTGSGKTLALLCAALAWQEAEQAKCDEFNKLLEMATLSQDPQLREVLLSSAGSEGVEWEEDGAPPDISDGGFIPEQDDVHSTDYHLSGGQSDTVRPPEKLKMPKRKKCPKIFFGTRTHKQVAQIVRELKCTSYSKVKMTILASREHTCIHPTVSKSFNKNQDCQDLLDKRKGGGCRFQANVKQKMASHYSVRNYIGTDTAWDLEDLVKAGRKVKACPYFSVRELKNTAQLIICPYNYLVDPKIRSSMDINLANQILILDEAHNIEDSARDAAGGSFKLDDVVTAMQDCERMVEHKVIPEVHKSLADFLSRLSNWMQKCSTEKANYTDFNSSSRVMTGTVGLAEWNQLVFAPDSYSDVKALLEEALREQSAAQEQNNEGFEEGNTKVLSKKTTDLIGGLFTVLDFMHRKDSSYRDDYRISIVKAQEKAKGGKGKGWLGRGQATFVSTVTLNFWCLNPGVCFDELLPCRSIVLTSGTLSPMLTFASELDVKFPVTLEANHVIDRKQVWAGSIGSGPTGHSLNATYHNSNSYGFQDEVGRLILDICCRVPHGVLVFLPSYKLLNDLLQRWQSTGLWTSLFERKAILSEPRFGDELETVMKEFYSVVTSTNHSRNELGQDGALFLAVCRGKVSEGLDFADNNARAVVCVGIPFPAVKDTLVDLKKKYNDERKKQKPEILPGRDWYEIQAFRALNQALGRCIRHKNDWGAILMVDDRYAKNPRYVSSLSKWVRGRVVNFNNSADMLHSLNDFTTEMKQLDKDREEVVPQPHQVQEKTEEEPGAEAVGSAEKGDEEWIVGKKIDLVRKSAWSPKEDETLSKRVAKLGKLKGDTLPLRENKLIANLSSDDHLDSKTHLNSDRNLNGLPSSETINNFPVTYLPTTDQMKGTKRKHSSGSEANFDIGEIVVSPEFMSGDFSVKDDLVKENQKAPEICHVEDPPAFDDCLPNMTGNFSDDSHSAPKYFEDPVLKYSKLDRESSEDRQLHQLLLKRRKMKQQKLAQFTESQENVPGRSNNVSVTGSSDGKKSNRKPLFITVSQEEKNKT